MPIRYLTEEGFPNTSLNWFGTTLLVREITIMLIMNLLSDKPDWDRKVFDEAIVKKWRAEALAMDGMDVSEKMLDWVSRYISIFVAFSLKRTKLFLDCSSIIAEQPRYKGLIFL